MMKDIDFGRINIKLDEIMKEKEIPISRLAYRAEMQRTQLKSYMKNDVRRIDLAVLARLCYALDCSLNDLLEYVPPDSIE